MMIPQKKELISQLKKIENELEQEINTKKALEQQLEEIKKEKENNAKTCEEKTKAEKELLEKEIKKLKEECNKQNPTKLIVGSGITYGINNLEEIKEAEPTIPWQATSVAQVKPLRVLLNRNDLTAKLIVEAKYGNSYVYMYKPQIASYYSYGGYNSRISHKSSITGQTTKRWIHLTKLLADSVNQLYFDKIFKIVEQSLNDSGIKCHVKKSSTFHPSYQTNPIILFIGSLPFINLDITKYENKIDQVTEESKKDDPCYYIQVSFDVILDSGKTISYKGVTLLLTDRLSLYEFSK